MKMKDSGIEWIGEIPETWEVVKIKYYLSRNDIKNHPDEEVLSVYRDYGVVPKNSRTDNHNVTSTDTTNYKYVIEGNLVINKMKAWQGSLAVSNYTGIVSPAYYVYQFKNSKLNKRYFHYLIRNCYKSEFKRLSTGIRDGQWDLQAYDFENTSITLPPKSEQQQIADYLDHKTAEIDGLIEKINTEIDTLKQYQSSVITQAVTKGLDPNVPMKDSGIEWIGEIPETWKVPKLKHLLLEPMKYGATESGVSYSDKLPRYIRITDITLDGNLKDIGKLSLTEQQAKNYILDDKDILFARSGATVGKTFFYRSFMGKSAFAGYLISAKIDEKKLDPKWVYYFTQTTSYMTWINNVFSQSTIQNISAEKYSNLPISMTYDIKEQRRIVDYLDNKVSQIKKIIKSKQQQITELTEYKNSLIFEYVTGKKQVKEAN